MFRIDSRVRQGCIMTSLTFQCLYGCSEKRSEDGDGKRGVRFLEDGKEWRLPCLL